MNKKEYLNKKKFFDQKKESKESKKTKNARKVIKAKEEKKITRNVKKIRETGTKKGTITEDKIHTKSRQSGKLTNKNLEDLYLKIGQDIWPLEKDILYRPDRYKYVRKLLKGDGCVFCISSENISFESLCVYKSKYSMIVINKFPYNSGHLLVLPIRHCGNLLELSDEEYFELQSTLRFATRAMLDLYNPGGFNIGVNHGSVAGAGIPEHLHYHIVPRWSGDLNFFPLIAETKVVIEPLEITFDRYLGYFKSHEL